MQAAFKGQRAGQSAVRDDRMPHGPDVRYHPFSFMHHTGDHGGWCLGVDKDEHGRPVLDADGNEQWILLPVLKPFYHRPGVAGVKTGARGSDRADVAVAMARHQERGWIFLDWKSFPNGYLVQYEGVRGTVYMDVFSEPRIVRRENPITLVEFDSPGCPARAEEGISWTQWRKSLVTSKVVPPPSPFVVDRLVRIQENRTGRLIRDAHIPQVAAQMETEFRRLEALEDFQRHLEDATIAARKGTRATPTL